MGQVTKIGWCDHTMNFWWGCHRVSTECKSCYIGSIMRRAGVRDPFAGPLRTKNWSGPAKWNRVAKREGRRQRVFTGSMSDFFHEGADAGRDEAWKVIRSCRWLDWLILTKRPERILTCLPADWNDGYTNVWLGVACGHSNSYYRLPYLLSVPAVVRFVSAEPLLETLNLTPWLLGIDWVITGCEQAASGKRRRMDLDWVREIDRQCREFGKAHFFKQYYRGERGRPRTDGWLDGVVQQEWPVPRIPVCDQCSGSEDPSQMVKTRLVGECKPSKFHRGHDDGDIQ